MESRLRAILELASRAAGKSAGEKIDLWLLSRLNRRLADIDGKFQRLEHRELIKELLYDTSADLAWYLKRAKEPRLREFFEKWALAIAPFAPHAAEEIWHAMGKEGFAIAAPMPSADASLVDGMLEMREELITKVMEDVEKISSLTGMKPKKASIFTAAGWKREAYSIAREEKNFEKAMKRCMAKPGLEQKGADMARFLRQIGKNLFSLPGALGSAEELDALSEASGFMGSQLGILIEVAPEENASHPKAKNAMPGKPAIVLE